MANEQYPNRSQSHENMANVPEDMPIAQLLTILAQKREAATLPDDTLYEGFQIKSFATDDTRFTIRYRAETKAGDLLEIATTALSWKNTAIDRLGVVMIEHNNPPTCSGQSRPIHRHDLAAKRWNESGGADIDLSDDRNVSPITIEQLSALTSMIEAGEFNPQATKLALQFAREEWNIRPIHGKNLIRWMCTVFSKSNAGAEGF